MPLATQADVETLLLRPLSTEEQGFLPRLLDMADAVIAGYAPGIDLMTPPEDVVVVAADLIRAAVTNPTGAKEEEIGSYRVAYGDTPPGLVLSQAHREVLDRHQTP